MGDIETLACKAERALASLDGAVFKGYEDRVRRELAAVLPELARRHGENGQPTHRILRAVTEDRFEGVQDPGVRHYLQLVLGDVCGRVLDDLDPGAKPRRIVEGLPAEVRAAMEKVDSIGKGISIFGSARTQPGDEDYELTRELARELSLMLRSPIWTGAGPGQMEAALAGAVEAKGTIGGIKINLPDGFEQDVCALLGPDRYTRHHFFSGRKIGLLYAATREQFEERTGLIVAPGGIGTLDETMEQWVLMQTGKLGSKWAAPFVIANYKGYYTGLLEWMKDKMVRRGYIDPAELELACVCTSNREILEEYADFYGIPEEERRFRARVPKYPQGQGDLFPDHHGCGFYRNKNRDCRV
ncbi:MAG: LOG family protein [Patescibacteria group bacterium]